jgi:5'-nucleotidase (lipoprotein e(P4) family)
MSPLRSWLAVFSLSLVFACDADNDAEEIGSDEGQLAATGTGGDAKVLPNAIHWARNSTEHQALVLQTYRFATMHVEAARAKDNLKDGAWGVVLDADETVVDNTKYNMERAFSAEGSTSESWEAWVLRKESGLLAGALPFLQRVKALGGRVFIVTGRAEKHCPATKDNLRALKIPFDALLCKSPSDKDKNARFQAIEQGRSPSTFGATKVVLYLGDNILDFPGLDQTTRSDQALAPFGSRFILLPNPMYGSWESLERK